MSHHFRKRSARPVKLAGFYLLENLLVCLLLYVEIGCLSRERFLPVARGGHIVVNAGEDAPDMVHALGKRIVGLLLGVYARIHAPEIIVQTSRRLVCNAHAALPV